MKEKLMSDERFPAAKKLFFEYFHQDYEGPPEGVVVKFVDDQPRKTSRALIEDINSILQEFSDEASLEVLLDSYRNCFDVLRFKPSYRSWLEEIKGIAEARLMFTSKP